MTLVVMVTASPKALAAVVVCAGIAEGVATIDTPASGVSVPLNAPIEFRQEVGGVHDRPKGLGLKPSDAFQVNAELPELVSVNDCGFAVAPQLVRPKSTEAGLIDTPPF